MSRVSYDLSALANLSLDDSAWAANSTLRQRMTRIVGHCDSDHYLIASAQRVSAGVSGDPSRSGSLLKHGLRIEMEFRERHIMAKLFQRERYTPTEPSELLGISVNVICNASYPGELLVQIAAHHIVDIKRRDVLAWLSDVISK